MGQLRAELLEIRIAGALWQEDEQMGVFVFMAREPDFDGCVRSVLLREERELRHMLVEHGVPIRGGPSLFKHYRSPP